MLSIKDLSPEDLLRRWAMTLIQRVCGFDLIDEYEKVNEYVIKRLSESETIQSFASFHPRAVKLLRKKKEFLVVAFDEPYFMQVYNMIRSQERINGTWSELDELVYLDQYKKKYGDIEQPNI